MTVIVDLTASPATPNTYATVDDVARLNSARTLTDRSKPTASDAAGFLAQVSSELDATLAERGYQTPVPTSATAARELLAYYNALGANALIERAAPDSPSVDRAEQMWDNALKALQAGKVGLADAPRDQAEIRFRAPAVATPMFSRDMDL